MTLQRPEDLISAWLDGELTDAERAMADELLATSAAARAERDQSQELSRALREIPLAEVPAGFRDAILQQLTTATIDVNRGPTRRTLWRELGVVLAGLAVTAAAVMMLLPSALEPPHSQAVVVANATGHATPHAALAEQHFHFATESDGTIRFAKPRDQRSPDVPELRAATSPAVETEAVGQRALEAAAMFARNASQASNTASTTYFTCVEIVTEQPAQALQTLGEALAQNQIVVVETPATSDWPATEETQATTAAQAQPGDALGPTANLPLTNVLVCEAPIMNCSVALGDFLDRTPEASCVVREPMAWPEVDAPVNELAAEQQQSVDPLAFKHLAEGPIDNERQRVEVILQQLADRDVKELATNDRAMPTEDTSSQQVPNAQKEFDNAAVETPARRAFDVPPRGDFELSATVSAEKAQNVRLEAPVPTNRNLAGRATQQELGSEVSDDRYTQRSYQFMWPRPDAELYQYQLKSEDASLQENAATPTGETASNEAAGFEQKSNLLLNSRAADFLPRRSISAMRDRKSSPQEPQPLPITIPDAAVKDAAVKVVFIIRQSPSPTNAPPP